jgi:Intron-binding protein aquarius N-terminus
VREDLADVLQRVGASWDEEREDPVVKFRGWARMAMPLAGFDIIEVKPPKVRRRPALQGVALGQCACRR